MTDTAPTPGRGASAPAEAKQRIVELVERAQGLADCQAARGTAMGIAAAGVLANLRKGLDDPRFFAERAGYPNLGLSRGASDLAEQRGDGELLDALYDAERAWYDLIWDEALLPWPDVSRWSSH